MSGRIEFPAQVKVLPSDSEVPGNTIRRYDKADFQKDHKQNYSAERKRQVPRRKNAVKLQLQLNTVNGPLQPGQKLGILFLFLDNKLIV